MSRILLSVHFDDDDGGYCQLDRLASSGRYTLEIDRRCEATLFGTAAQFRAMAEGIMRQLAELEAAK